MRWAASGKQRLWRDVTEYLKGSTKPYATITKGLTYPIGIAIDHAGNLYISNYRLYSDQNVQGVHQVASHRQGRSPTECRRPWASRLTRTIRST